MENTEDERSILEELDPGTRADTDSGGDEHSILDDLNQFRVHIEVLEEAARAARSVEFDQVRMVVAQLEAVADAAKAAERDLSHELADTKRMSVATARVVRDRLAFALRALADALGGVESSG